jgi:hypothetical protein
MKVGTILKLFHLVKTSDGLYHVASLCCEITKGMAVIIPHPTTKALVLGAATHVSEEHDFIQVHTGTERVVTKLSKTRHVALEFKNLIHCGLVHPDQQNPRHHLERGEIVYHDITSDDIEKIMDESNGYVWMEMEASTLGKVEHVSGKRLIPKVIHGKHLLQFYKPVMQPAEAS